MAKFLKNKDYIKNEIVLLKELKVKQEVFRVWFNGAMRRAPISLLANKIERASRKIELRRGLQAIVEQGIFDEDLEYAAADQVKARELSLARDCLQTWVKAFKVRQISHKVAKSHNKMTQGKYFAQWQEMLDI